MTFKKILLKTNDGRPVACLTVGGKPSAVTLPANVKAEACLAGELFFPVGERRFLLPQNAEDFSLLGRLDGEEVFATTLPQDKVNFVRWRLRSALEKRRKEPVSPEPITEEAPAALEPSAEEEDAPVIEETPFAAPTEQRQTQGESEVVLEEKESTLSRAKRLMEKGAPFPLFEKLMPASRWALVEDDDAAYLIGITERDGQETVIYGVPGARSFPPDDGELWSFFPTENDEVGYFLTEAKE